MSTPTERSLKYLRKNGWRCAVVEKWNPAIKRRNDLFGFGDILAIKDDQTLIVQTTSASHVAERITKIVEDCAEALADVRKAGWLIHVHGWRKAKQGNRMLWVLRQEDVS